jgi:hypothetical protein
MGKLISLPGWRFGAVLIRPPHYQQWAAGVTPLGFLREKLTYCFEYEEAWSGRALCGWAEFPKASTLLGKRRKVVFIMGSLMFQPLSRWQMARRAPSLAGYRCTVFGCYILICESVTVRFESTAVQHSDREFHVWIGSLPKIVRFEFYHIFRGKGPEEKFTVAHMMFVWGDFKAYTVY